MLPRSAPAPSPLPSLFSPPPSLLEFLSLYSSFSPSHPHLPSNTWPRTKLSSSTFRCPRGYWNRVTNNGPTSKQVTWDKKYVLVYPEDLGGRTC